MQLSQRVLGKHTVDAIAARASAPLLTIGKDTFYRRDFADVGCFNFLAAANLSAAIADLQPRDTKDIFDNFPPSALVVPRVGSISLAVLGAAFEKRGLGGDQPLESWFSRHRPPQADNGREFVTFDSLKHAEHLHEIGETRARKARKERSHGRRNKAQHLRVDRYMTRQGVRANGS